MNKILLRKLFLNLIVVLFSVMVIPNLSIGQGAIITSGTTALGNPLLLNPDGDGDIVASGTTFTSPTTELQEMEQLISGNNCSCERPWTSVGGIIADPRGTTANMDLNGSGSCGNTDIISDGSDPANGPFDHAYYTIFDGDGNCNTNDIYIAFRIRVAQAASGSFSFEILASTDGLIGTDDPDGIKCCGAGKAANIGFEREIQLQTNGGGKGVNTYNIDGAIGINYGNSPVVVSQYTLANNSQVATASGKDPGCSGIPVFYTFFVPLSDLGIGCAQTFTDLAFVAVSTQSVNPAIAKCTSTSDIGGVDGASTNSNCGTGPYSGNCADNAAVIDALLCAAGSFNPPLPVEFTSFTAQEKDKGVVLNWSTASEQNNLGFDIERSNDGRTWETLDFVPGRGTTNETIQYSYEDKQPAIGYNYYRLKQMDYDGRFEYSKIVNVLMDAPKGGLLKVFPNPSNGVFRVSLSNPNKERAFIKLLDSTGSLIWIEQFNSAEADVFWEKEFDLPQREVYFLVTQVGNHTETQKVVIIDKK